MDRKKEIGQRILKVRQKLRMTQRQFGELFCVEHNTISTYENGDAYPAIENLIKLAEIARVSIGWLLMGTDEKTPLNKLLTPEELRLLYDFRSAPEPTRKKIVKIVEVMIEEEGKD